MSARTATPVDTSQQVPNRLALGLIALGAVLGVLALTVLDWFRGSVGVVRGAHSTVVDLGALVDRLADIRPDLGGRDVVHLGLSDYYYDWLGWALLAAAVIVAVVATLPTSEGRQLRVLGGLIAVLGLAATVFAVDVYRVRLGSGEQGFTYSSGDTRTADEIFDKGDGPGIGHFFAHLGVGGWFAIAAFVLIGAGAVLGPRHARS